MIETERSEVIVVEFKIKAGFPKLRAAGLQTLVLVLFNRHFASVACPQGLEFIIQSESSGKVFATAIIKTKAEANLEYKD